MSACPNCGIQGELAAQNGNVYRCGFAGCSVIRFKGEEYGDVGI